MNRGWLGSAGAGRQYAPAAPIGRLRAAPTTSPLGGNCDHNSRIHGGKPIAARN